MITFSATPYKLNGYTILRVPREKSALFSSRSQIMASGTVNGKPFTGPLEPDGKGSHWLDLTHIDIKPASVDVSIEQTNEWPEPTMPKEFLEMLADHPEAKATYDKATPMAHWEWLRWTISTKNPETYKKHIEVSRSKLTKGMRRPCCFNRAACTVADVAKSGVLIDPHET